MKKKKTLIIAEAGVNHNGKIKIAKEMIDVASEAGADFIKFQTFEARKIATKNAKKSNYQLDDKNENQYQMLRRLELTEKNHIELIDHCRKRGIIFLSSPFDNQSIDMLARLGQNIYKIPSGENNNLPFLRKIGRLNKEIIMSSGMTTFKQIKESVNVLVSSGTKKEKITVLHCTSEYPAPYNEVNLLAMPEIGNKLGVNYGYSDHTESIEIAVAAVALGARVIEKHFTLSKEMEGPDHKASIVPEDLFKLVKFVRNIEKSLGSKKKIITLSEQKNIVNVRKSIVAAYAIKKGEIFTENNLTLKRPATGISPMSWDKVIGTVATKSYIKDELIK